jgi:hypothetical protein
MVCNGEGEIQIQSLKEIEVIATAVSKIGKEIKIK